MTLTETPYLTFPKRLAGLVGLLIVADLMLWDVRPGIGLAFLILLAGGVAAAFQGGAKPVAWGILCLSLLPLVENVGPLSLLFGWGGLTVFCASLVADAGGAWPAVLRMPGWAIAQDIRDVIAAPGATPRLKGVGWQEWIIPAVLGTVFIALFAAANPVIDGWFMAVMDWDGPVIPDTARLALWLICAFAFWPLMRLAKGADRLNRPFAAPALRRARFLSAGSVLKSLLTFNVIFAVQSLSDLAFLTGGIALPDGMTYAQYAHRGAYPLLVTALLAGAFALLVQPFLQDRPALRWLLMIWVAQNVLLVASSILRLELYVDVYGLTRLRFAAFIWMALVATGLAIMVAQVATGRPALWLMKWSAGLAAAVLYTCTFVNVDGVIAEHNLSRGGDALDTWYICQLSSGAVPAIADYEAAKKRKLCYSSRPYLHRPRDVREWGFRNMRLRRSLAQIEGASA